MDGIERVTTARLVGCRPAFRDADELHEVMADEQVAAWLWPAELGGPRTLSQVRAMLVHDADHWKRHGWGPWVVRDAASRAMVGRVGLHVTEVEGAEEVELAWMIRSSRWGEGLATEMAAEAVRVAFGHAGLERIVAYTVPDNAASRAVMTKLGMTYERDIEAAGLPHVLYALTRSP